MNAQHIASFAFTLFVSAVATAHADNWPQFRGPTGQGHVDGPAPRVWSESQNIVWKTPLPGKGWSSPVVWGDQIWMTTAIVTNASHDEAKASLIGLLPPAEAELADKVSLHALCVDRNTGALLHDIELFTPESVEVIHSLNSYASPTPVIEEGRVYCHFGTYGNACLDTTSGEVLWRRVIPVKHYVGPGSSPVLHRGLLVLTYDGADDQFITALDKETGSPVWRTDRPAMETNEPDFHKAYCTPIVTEIEGREMLIVPGAQWLVAYDPLTGDELWRYNHGRGFSTVPRPVERDNIVYFATGFLPSTLVAIRGDGAGQLSDADVIWKSTRQAPEQASPVLLGDRVFTVSDRGIGVCLDVEQGSVVWRGRLGRSFSASPLAADGLVYFFSREGVATLVDAASPQFTKVQQNQLDGQIMATPAILDGRMYLRTDTHLYCIAE